MSLCPIIVGSVGFFAATTSLLADPPSVFIRALPEGVRSSGGDEPDQNSTGVIFYRLGRSCRMRLFTLPKHAPGRPSPGSAQPAEPPSAA